MSSSSSVEVAGAPAHDMQDRAEHLLGQSRARSSATIVGAHEGAARRQRTLASQRKRTAPRCHGGDPAHRACPWPRRRSPDRHGSPDRADRRASVRAPRRRPWSSMRSATSSCTQSSRSAEQRWPAERKAEATTSSATCSGSAVASTIMALMPPVSAISGTIGPSLAASARLIARATSVEPVKATPATRASRDQRGADLAVARHQMQRGSPARRRRAAASPPRRRSAASARRAWRPRCCRRRARAATWPVKIASGKFHGLMQTNTPRPRWRSSLLSPVGPGSGCGANARRACAA